jgi:hypothetical protein
VTPAPPSTLSRVRNSRDESFSQESRSQSTIAHLPPLENQQSPSKGGLAEAIALRLASMSEAEQRQLLLMLNLVDEAQVLAPSVKPTSPAKVQETLKLNSLSERSEKRVTRSPRAEDHKREAVESSNTNSPKKIPQSPVPKRKIPIETSPIQEVKAVLQAPLPVEPSSIDSTSLASLTTIKIKLHNNWKRTKFASLASIRLLEVGENRDLDLSAFSTQVWIGNTMLPKTSDVARSASVLFSRSRVRQHKDWKFPIDSGTQLILTGQLNCRPSSSFSSLSYSLCLSLSLCLCLSLAFSFCLGCLSQIIGSGALDLEWFGTRSKLLTCSRCGHLCEQQSPMDRSLLRDYS